MNNKVILESPFANTDVNKFNANYFYLCLVARKIMKEDKDFDSEKARLIAYIDKTFEEGSVHYEGLENMTFGKLSSKQWNNLFSKHLDHHLTQFGV